MHRFCMLDRHGVGVESGKDVELHVVEVGMRSSEGGVNKRVGVPFILQELEG